MLVDSSTSMRVMQFVTVALEDVLTRDDPGDFLWRVVPGFRVGRFRVVDDEALERSNDRARRPGWAWENVLGVDGSSRRSKQRSGRKMDQGDGGDR